MKKLVLSLAALLLVGLFAACNSGSAASGSKEATITLEGNPTTGYSWAYAVSPEGVVEEVSNNYEQDPTSASDMVGVGGTFTYVFKGLAEGEAQVTFTYSQSWDTSTEPAETVVYLLKVDKDLNVTATQQ